LHLSLHVYHIDDETSFFNSPLKFSIWIKLPKGISNEKGQRYAKLRKLLLTATSKLAGLARVLGRVHHVVLVLALVPILATLFEAVEGSLA
jgi:hypothetical protein